MTAFGAALIAALGANQIQYSDLKNFDSSSLDFFPYVTASNERTTDDNDVKAGAEIFWKIDSGSQLNIAINPDS